MASEAVARRRSRSRSRPAAPGQEPPPVKPKRRWRRKSNRDHASNGSLATENRRASERYASIGGGEEEVATASDAAGGSPDGTGRPPPSSDRSDSSDDASEVGQDCDGAEHVGRRVISMEVPVHIDQLFAMLFTNSDFFQAFYQRLKYYDVSTTEWEDGENGCKTRRNRFLVDVMGKTSTSTVTEDQTMLPISRPGNLYIINAEVKNSGVPMSDVFYTTKHYCIHKLSSKRTQLDAWCQTKFRKSTLFKGFIEKTANEGMEEHHNTLEQTLNEWVGDPNQRKRKRVAGGRAGSSGAATSGAAAATSGTGGGGCSAPAAAAGPGRGLLLLVLGLTLLLLVLNGCLYLRLSRLGLQTERLLHGGLLQAGVRPDPEWLERMTSVRRQEEHHRAELARWQHAVRAAAELVRQSESALNQLQGTLEVEPDSDRPSDPTVTATPPPPVIPVAAKTIPPPPMAAPVA